MSTLLLLIIILIIVLVYVVLQRAPVKSVYTYYVEPSTIDPDFPQKVEDILRRSSWNEQYNIRRQSVDGAVVRIKLVDRATMIAKNPPKDKYADGSPIYFSFTKQSTSTPPEIWIDADNWRYGVSRSGLSVADYQKYVINHEFGHALGMDHVKCGDAAVCPVMWQSTRGCGKSQCGADVTKADFDAPLISFRYRL